MGYVSRQLKPNQQIFIKILYRKNKTKSNQIKETFKHEISQRNSPNQKDVVVQEKKTRMHYSVDSGNLTTI